MVSYLLRQPEKLENLAMAELGRWIGLQAEQLTLSMSQIYLNDAVKAEDLLTKYIEIIRNFLAHNLPGIFHNNLLNVIVKEISYLLSKTEPYGEKVLQKNEIGRRMIETIFTKNLTTLWFNNYAWQRLQDSFCSKSYMITEITHFRLSGFTSEANILKLVKELHKLTFLTLRSICTDNILKCIAEHCTLIESLDLTNSKLNDNSVDILIQLPNLKRIKLYQTQVTYKGIEMLLKSCKNIENIGTYVNVAMVLEHIVKVEESSENHFNLKVFNNHNQGTTLAQLHFLVRVCPQIQKIKLTKNSTDTSHDYLIALTNLRNLRELKLDDFDFYTDHVKDVLLEIGHNLVHLYLEEVCQIDLNAIMYLYYTCPNLQSLSLYDCSYSYQGSYDLFPIQIEILPLTYLKRLFVTGWEDVPLTHDQFIFLLSNCPNVEFVTIGMNINNVMLKVFDNNPLIYLKELKISQRKVSMLIMDRIIQNCVNYPEVIESYY